MTRNPGDKVIQLETARWWKRLKETNNVCFLPLYFDKHRYIVLKGGGGSGKSIFAGRYVLERVTTEPGHRWLVCRKVARTLRESCFAQLRGQLLEHYPGLHVKINKSDMVIDFPHNKSRIIFAGLDDAEKLKSIYDITGIWLEEASEALETDFNQLDIRLRTNFPYQLTFVLSFNPVSITHWLKKRFFDRHDPDARVHESTYKDNRFLTPAAVKVLEGFRDTDEYYYMVYALGMWGVSGKTVFNGRALQARLEAIQARKKRGTGNPSATGTEVGTGNPSATGADGGPHPLRGIAAPTEVTERRGFFTYNTREDLGLEDIRWVEDESGPVRIYREPEAGRPYVIGGDTAGDGSDWFTGQVLDNGNGRQVAVLRHQYDEDTYARQIYCLGRYYNDALLGIETNFSTYPVKLLQMMHYPRLYVREREDSYEGDLQHAFGFRTDRITRPLIIGGLVDVMREHLDTIEDEETILEMMSFIRNAKLRAEAEPGAHDDLVMALAIAHYIRPQQTTHVPLRPGKKNVWTEDMWEDYWAGSSAQQAEMIRQWGEPA